VSHPLRGRTEYIKMRLLRREHAHNYCLTDELEDDDIPVYAILSHTWEPDNMEVTFKDFVRGSGTAKAGYKKIEFCGEQAAKDLAVRAQWDLESGSKFNSTCYWKFSISKFSSTCH
jgi:hypothetical protein